MARTVTLSALQTEIRNRGEIRSAYISDSELTTMINGSIAELYDLLLSVNPDYYLSSDTISVTASTAAYALPSDYYKTRGVDVSSSGYYYNMPRFSFSERNKYQVSGGDPRNCAYAVVGSLIRFMPAPSWSGSVTHWYIPAPTKLVSTSNTFDGISGWEEYVVVDCLIKSAAKSQDDATIYVAQKAALIERIRGIAPERDFAEPRTIRDVYQEGLVFDGRRFLW